MRRIGGRRHEQLAVHQLVARRCQRVLVDERAYLAGGPTALDGRHGHNVLGSTETAQADMSQAAPHVFLQRHRSVASLIPWTLSPLARTAPAPPNRRNA